jgi:zinc protease
MVSGALLPTADPFLYSLSLTAMRDVPLATLEAAALEALDEVRREGLTTDEVSRAKRQLKARLVFEVDSVTSLAHQLGYFETTVGSGFFEKLRPCVEAVTPEQVADVARRRLGRDTRTVGWFQPVMR